MPETSLENNPGNAPEGSQLDQASSSDTPPVATEEAGGAAVTATMDAPGEEAPEKLTQDVIITDVGPCRKKIMVSVDRGTIDKRVDKKYSELVGDSWIPGFRPGKAPREIVVRKFKKDVLNEIRGQILMESLEQLAEEHDVAPISPPNLNPNKIFIPDKGPFTYEFEVEVRPSFELPNYKGLKLNRPIKTFTDAEVEQEENRFLSQFGQLIPKDGSALKGDYIIVDMATEYEGKQIGSAKELTLRVDDTLAFKDSVATKFGEQTIGCKAGETRVVDISMTDAVAVEALKGKTVKATLEIKDVKSLRLPEMSEDFLERYGVRTPEQFRELIRTQLDRRLEYTQRQSAREQFLQKVVVATSWDLPHDLLMRQSRKALQRRVLEMKEAGMSEEEIKGRQRLLERDILQSTALTLKEHFVLQKIAEDEKIEIDDDEIEAEIARIAAQTHETPRRVRAQLEREDMLETLAAQIIERKSLDLILSSAEYVDVPLEPEKSVASAEAQAVEGQLKDPTAAPPEPKEDEGQEEKTS